MVKIKRRKWQRQASEEVEEVTCAYKDEAWLNGALGNLVYREVSLLPMALGLELLDDF